MEMKYDDRGREQVKAWYALVVYPGRELKIRDKLIKLSQNEALKDQIKRVIVPAKVEQAVDKEGNLVFDKKGNPKNKEVLIYTQYVYIEMILNDHTYHAVKIDGVRHILGEPTAITHREMTDIFEKMGKVYIKDIGLAYQQGDQVEVIDRKQTDYYRAVGNVLESDAETRVAKVLINGELLSFSFNQLDKK